MVNVLSQPKMSFKRIRDRPIRQVQPRLQPKTVPNEVLGITATSSQFGMEGCLEWLKCVKIHKYWAFFSHLSYDEMISLRDENLDWFLAKLGAEETFCEGTRRKVLRSIEELRSRSNRLMAINPTHIEESCTIISSVLKTPISDCHLEEDGTSLSALLKLKITQVVNTSRVKGVAQILIKKLLEEYIGHQSILEYDKLCARQWLEYIRNNTFYKHQNRLINTNQPSDFFAKIQWAPKCLSGIDANNNYVL